jgi:hypothetical protein
MGYECFSNSKKWPKKMKIFWSTKLRKNHHQDGSEDHHSANHASVFKSSEMETHQTVFAELLSQLRNSCSKKANTILSRETQPTAPLTLTMPKEDATVNSYRSIDDHRCYEIDSPYLAPEPIATDDDLSAT